MAEHPVACAAWQEDLAGWLVAQLPPEREARLVEHLAGCAACREEADSLGGVAAAMLAAAPSELGSGRPVGAGDAPSVIVERAAVLVRRGRRARRMAWAGLLSVVAVLVIALVASATRVDETEVEGTEVAFAVAPDGASASAVIAPDDGASVVELVATGLDPDLTYALWLSPLGATLDDRVPAGTFRPDERGDVSVVLRCSLPPDRYDRAWATTPTGAVVLDTRSGPTYRDGDGGVRAR